MKILFIGNSATYKHDVPQTLVRLATQAGYPTAADMIATGGRRLSQHVEDESVFEKIKNGYDLVVIQDNADCVSSDDMRQKCKEACHVVCTAFATIFNTSAAALGCGEINLEEAKVLQAIADEVAQVKD